MHTAEAMLDVKNYITLSKIDSQRLMQCNLVFQALGKQHRLNYFAAKEFTNPLTDANYYITSVILILKNNVM